MQSLNTGSPIGTDKRNRLQPPACSGGKERTGSPGRSSQGCVTGDRGERELCCGGSSPETGGDHAIGIHYRVGKQVFDLKVA